MKWLPTVRAVVEKLASSPASVTVFSAFVPSLNVTVPVGLAPPVTVTVAANVIDSPTVDGFADDFNVVLVGSIFTKSAVTVCGPSIVTDVEALPALATPPVQFEKT